MPYTMVSSMCQFPSQKMAPNALPQNDSISLLNQMCNKRSNSRANVTPIAAGDSSFYGNGVSSMVKDSVSISSVYSGSVNRS